MGVGVSLEMHGGINVSLGRLHHMDGSYRAVGYVGYLKGE
jgi:hypothetical protein